MTPTTVLICDDSRSYAAALRAVLEHDETIRVVGVSPTAEHALKSITRLRPELVTMDLDLPGMDGLSGIREIMRTHPLPIVVLSAFTPRGSRKASAAIAAGALEVLSKSAICIADIDRPPAADLRRRLRRLARARVAPPRANAVKREHHGRGLSARETSVIAIGASTGGPRALLAVLRELPADFGVPVLVVQHIGAESLAALVEWIDREVALPVRVAVDGHLAGPGVWISPNGANLTIDRSFRLGLSHTPHACPHCPSVDALFESVATAFGPHAVGVVLTGMGSDGAGGVAALIAAGAVVVAQDEASSVVFGMPRAAAAQGAQVVLPLGQIPTELLKLRPRSGPR
jgi:two-component system, chemotaxis family, protein-glutamate methylesterase/glutaminase